jgi:CRP-like cAMP-binding protein
MRNYELGGNLPSHHEQLSKIVSPFLKQYSKRIAAGSYIFKENDTAGYIYLVINGMVKLTKKCLNQSEMQLSIAKPGTIAGLEAIFPYGYYYCSAIAATESVVCAVPKQEFLKVFHKYNSASFVIMDEAYRELNDMEERIVKIEERQSFQNFNRI